MGVQLNIKSAEARALAERLAEATGASITEAVTQSLRNRLAELRLETARADDPARDREVEFYSIIAGSRARWPGAMLSLDHGDMLYDELGLPR